MKPEEIPLIYGAALFAKNSQGQLEALPTTAFGGGGNGGGGVSEIEFDKATELLSETVTLSNSSVVTLTSTNDQTNRVDFTVASAGQLWTQQETIQFQAGANKIEIAPNYGFIQIQTTSPGPFSVTVKQQKLDSLARNEQLKVLGSYIQDTNNQLFNLLNVAENLTIAKLDKKTLLAYYNYNGLLPNADVAVTHNTLAREIVISATGPGTFHSTDGVLGIAGALSLDFSSGDTVIPLLGPVGNVRITTPSTLPHTINVQVQYFYVDGAARQSQLERIESILSATRFFAQETYVYNILPREYTYRQVYEAAINTQVQIIPASNNPPKEIVVFNYSGTTIYFKNGPNDNSPPNPAVDGAAYPLLPNYERTFPRCKSAIWAVSTTIGSPLNLLIEERR